VPSVVYTNPEIAWAGLSEEQAKAAGHEVKTGSSPFAANGRARAMESITGMIKIISDAKTDRVLGVHMIGPYVSELVTEAVTAMEYGATTEDIQLTMHAHPTLSETFHEAALAVDGHAIHSANKRKPAAPGLELRLFTSVILSVAKNPAHTHRWGFAALRMTVCLFE